MPDKIEIRERNPIELFVVQKSSYPKTGGIFMQGNFLDTIIPMVITP